MEIKPNPFSLYDFLGYFTPGSLFIYGVLFAIGYLDPAASGLSNITQKLTFSKVEIYIPFILGSYVLGHLLSFISSITIEKYSVWAMGYPSKYLIGIKHEGYFSVTEHVVIRKFLRILVALLLLPVSLMDGVLGYICGMRDLYAKSLDSLLIQLLRDKVLALLKVRGEVAEPQSHGSAATHDFFRYVYHYTVENAPHHLPKMQNYVALYGFLRTITAISVIFFWAGVWFVAIHPVGLGLAASLLVGTALVCYLFYMSFVKFYRRFTLEALMAMSVCFQSKP